MMWVLIMTLYVYSGESMQVDSVDGFKSFEQCAAAGKAWENHMRNQSLSGWAKGAKPVKTFTLCANKG